MKKWIAALLLLCMALGLCACAGENTNTTTQPTTEPPVSSEETTESTVETTVAKEPAYVVMIKDADGKPISGAIVQMCKLGDDGSCTPGTPSDAEGKVGFDLPEDKYKVSFIVLPAGYTYVDENQEFYFEEDATELTITLKKA